MPSIDLVKVPEVPVGMQVVWALRWCYVTLPSELLLKGEEMYGPKFGIGTNVE